MSESDNSDARKRPGGETTAHHNESTLPDAGAGPDGVVKPRVEPQLPHEKDESASSQASASAQHGLIGKQAYADTVGPGIDTDRGPVMDKVYNESVAPREADVPPRQ